ncbi:MAG TPA: protein kinase [Gaiellaceae bacterium]|nr:protein kinase [Gaiellaceae bacterium]
MSQPRVGDVVADRYELEAVCGSGGMSSVFRAHDVQLDRLVAVKILHDRYADEDEYVQRFLREARAVAQLSHPNIVTVIDRGEDEGRHYIVFEYVEGENLKELIVRSGRLPLRRAVELAIAIADGLAFAHAHGLVHRDVKPQNVLLNRSGDVKVTDFGIARSLDVEHGVTQTGTVLGTGEYLAPEQASGEPVSPATDEYSLGIVLWELVTGDVPFGGENFVAVALRHVHEQPPSLSDLRPGVPPRLAATIERALQKDPARRFPSMEAFADELRACLAGLDTEGATAVIPPPKNASDKLSLSRLPRKSPRFAARGFVVLAVLFAVAGLAAALLLSGAGRLGGASGAGAGTVVHLHGITTYDPRGGEQQALGSTAKYATDGSAATTWKTERYASQAFGNLKDGLGLVLSTGGTITLSRVTVATPTPGFTARIEVGSSPSGPFTADSVTEPVSSTTTFALDGRAGSYWVVWITRLPPELSAEISNVTATR